MRKEMRWLESEEDLTEMLAGEIAVVFVFADWSEYARRGKDIFQEAERLSADSPKSRVSWWIHDSSSIDSLMCPNVHQWLVAQNQEGNFRMFPNIGMGHGSVIWSRRGKVIGFERSAEHCGTKGLMERMHKFLAESG